MFSAWLDVLRLAWSERRVERREDFGRDALLLEFRALRLLLNIEDAEIGECVQINKNDPPYSELVFADKRFERRKIHFPSAPADTFETFRKGEPIETHSTQIAAWERVG